MTPFDVHLQKKHLRQQLRAQGASLDPLLLKEASLGAIFLLEQLPEFIAARALALYFSLPGEIDTRTLIHRWYGRKQILLPVMQGDQLILREFQGESLLTQHPYRVWEPLSGRERDFQTVDLILVPGVAFDPQGRRLGRGQGFYDRLLSHSVALESGQPLHSPLKIGICFHHQLVDEVPAEAHDVVMDRLIVGGNLKTSGCEAARLVLPGEG